MDTDSTLPPGLYDAVATTVTRWTSKNQRHFWKVEFEIVDEPYAETKVVANLLGPEDSDKASWIWKKAVDHPLELVVNTEVVLDLDVVEYRGIFRNRISKILPKI